MPIYEYECEECGAVFERLCRSAGDDKARCPDCDAEECRRLISRVAAPAAKRGVGGSCPLSAG
ncbi:MAG TPA: zinc ribbon domain-containing protein [bacterium]|nr:zinc ribbon domain-containing protein [bacterium]